LKRRICEAIASAEIETLPKLRDKFLYRTAWNLSVLLTELLLSSSEVQDNNLVAVSIDANVTFKITSFYSK
jgi:hypothetical protein